MVASVFTWKAAKIFDKIKDKLGDFFGNRLVKTLLIMISGILGMLLFSYLMIVHPLFTMLLILALAVLFVGFMIYIFMD